MTLVMLSSFFVLPISTADNGNARYTSKCGNPTPVLSYFSVVSGNGKVVVKTGKQTNVQVSVDNQLTWVNTEILSANALIFAAVNFDGSKIYVGDNAGGSKEHPNSGAAIWQSIDFGKTWTKENARPWNVFGNYGITGLATSGDGNTIYFAASDSHIYKSIDSGITWSIVPIDGYHQWTALSTSTSGKYLLVSAVDGAYFSKNYGLSSEKVLTFNGLSEVNQVSDDGRTLLVQEDFAGISHLSTDFGRTWSNFPGIAGGIALSNDGEVVVAKVISPATGIWNWAYSETKRIKWKNIESLSGGESGIYFYLYVGIHVSHDAKVIILGNCTNTRLES